MDKPQKESWEERVNRADFYVYGPLGMGINTDKLKSFIRAELERQREEIKNDIVQKLKRRYDTFEYITLGEILRIINSIELLKKGKKDA